jgi:serine/threonine protein kinase
VNAKDDPLEGQVVDDRYRLRRRIGSGGMSVVYLGEEQPLGKPIAIKFLRSAFANLPDFVHRFEQEAKACSLLSHVNCVSVAGFGVAFGSPYLVMEFLDGHRLSELLAKRPFSAKQAIDVTRQILSGLDHAHARGVVHRDLKPGNVMLVEEPSAPDGCVKIMDFGTAQLMSGDGPAAKGSGTHVGTPWYMAPEQAAGQPTDYRTDLYAVGVMLFEMLTGARPYTAEDPMRVLEMHLSSPIPSARALKPSLGLSPELEAVIVRAMQKQPAERFASAEEFDKALAETPEVKPRRVTGQTPAVSRADPSHPETRPVTGPVVGPPSASSLLAVESRQLSKKKNLMIVLVMVLSLVALFILFFILDVLGVLVF